MKSAAVNGAAKLFPEAAKKPVANQDSESAVGFSAYMKQASMQNRNAGNPDFMKQQSDSVAKKQPEMKTERENVKPDVSRTEQTKDKTEGMTAEQKPAEGKALEEKPTEQKPIEETATAENPAAEKPTGEKPAEENSVVENLVVENPVVENPVVENPVVENSMEENAGDGAGIGTAVGQQMPTKETLSQVETLVENVKQLFEDGFQMTEEDFLEALEKLGFTMMDLLNPKTAGECIQALSGVQDSMELLLDEQLYQTCTTLQKEVAALCDAAELQSQLSPEELEAVVGKLMMKEQAASENMQMPENLMEAMPESAAATDVSGARQTGIPAQGMNTPEKPVVEVVVVKEEKEPDTEYAQRPMGEVSEPEELPAGKISSSLMDEKPQDNNQNAQQQGMENQSLHGFIQQPEGIAFEPEVQTGFTTMRSEAFENIVRQIAEQIRIQVSADSSSMEMQLHPASLGRLELQVELRRGLVTARFIAESEQVKEVIEHQAVQLQEDLNKQGLKVEAVEVAVETHQFERNLEQGQEQQQAEEEAKSSESRTRKNLNLDMLGEEDELTEEEDLAAKIMRENGNTLDYFA